MQRHLLIIALIALTSICCLEILQAANIQNGITVYSEHCENCHGPSGQGMGGMGELRFWDELMKPDEALFETIKNGNMAMPGFDGMLTGEEILDVIAYMRTFQ